MKKALKVFGGLLVIVLLVVAVSSVVLHVLLPPEKAKALVLKQLTGHLKREVQIGDVSVGVLSGLDVSDLKISESPNFAHGTFVSSEHFSIRLALIPLIFREVEVRQLIFKHPVINVVRHADGKTFNFSDLMGPPPTSPPTKPAKTVHRTEPDGVFDLPEAYAEGPMSTPEAKNEEPPFKLVVSQAQIEEGVVHFVDQSPAKQSVDIDPLDLKLHNVSLTSPFSVQAFLQAKARDVIATLKLVGEADLVTGSFKVKNCALSSGGSTITLVGKANGLKSSRPSVDLTLDIKEFKLATLTPFVPLPKEFKLEGPILGNVRVKGDQKKMNFSALLNLEKVQVNYANQFSKPSHVPLGVSMSGDLTDLQDVDIAELKTVLGSLQLMGHGKVLGVNTSDPQVNFHLESNSFPVMELVGFAAASLPKDLNVKGNAQLAADVSGTMTSSHVAAKCEGKDLAVTFADKFVKPAGTPFHLAAVGEIIQPPNPSSKGKKSSASATQQFNFQNLSATLGDMDLSGSGSVQSSGQVMKLQVALKSNTFSLQGLSKMVPLLEDYRLSGSAATEVRASGTPQAPVANGSLTLQNVSAHYQQSDLSQIATALTFTQQDVSIPKLTGKLNGSDISLKLTGHRLTTQPDVDVEANITELDLAKLLPPPGTPAPGAPPAQQSWFPAWVPEASAAPTPATALGPMKLMGHLTVGHIAHEYYDAKNLDFKWNLTDVTPDLARVNGTSNLKQGPGHLNNIDKLAAQSKAARIALLPLTTLQKIDKGGILKSLGIPSLQSIAFDSILGNYVFTSGVMNIKNFDLTGQDLNLSTLGTIGLAGTQPLDVRVTMRLAAGAIGGLAQFAADSSGRPTLSFTAKGTVANPQVHLDVREVGQNAVKQIGQQLLQGFGLGGGQQQQTAPPANSPDNTQQAAPSNPVDNPADQLQKALKNIFH